MKMFVTDPLHDDVIKWKHFTRCWPFGREPTGDRWIPLKGQWQGALIFSLICITTNGWANSRDACDLRRHSAHYDVSVMTNMSRNCAICRWTGTNMDWLLISGWISNYVHCKIGAPLKSKNGKVISSHTLLTMWLLIHAGIEVISCQ